MFRESLDRFFYSPASPRPLAAFRVGVAAVLLAQAFAIAGDIEELFGDRGIVQWEVVDVMIPSEVPKLSWIAAALAAIGADAGRSVQVAFFAYIVSLSGLFIGWRTRACAALAWLTHLALKSSGAASAYGVDEFANIALFYCAVMPVAEAFSLDLKAGRVAGHPSWISRLSLRVLQFHLCLIYLASGLEKAAGLQWWNGEAIWRALMHPDFNGPEFAWLASAPWLAALLGWGTLVVEIGYAPFIWPRRTRLVWALATIGLHLGIAVSLGLWSFSAMMMVLTASAFLVPSSPSFGGALRGVWARFGAISDGVEAQSPRSHTVNLSRSFAAAWVAILIGCMVLFASLALAGDPPAQQHGKAAMLNGSDLGGWKASHPESPFSFIDGVLICRSDGSGSRDQYLISDGEYGDFRLQMKFRVVQGRPLVYYRSKVEGGRVSGNWYDLSFRLGSASPGPSDDWHALSLICRGESLEIFVDGTQTVDLNYIPSDRRRGPIALVSGSRGIEVQFKEIFIEPFVQKGVAPRN